MINLEKDYSGERIREINFLYYTNFENNNTNEEKYFKNNLANYYSEFMNIKTLLFLLFSSILFSQNFQNSIQEANKKAIANNKFILLHFSSKDCKTCLDFTRDFFYYSKYKNILDRFVIVTVDTNKNPDFTKFYKVNSVPNIKIIDVIGNVLHEFRNYENPEAAKAELSSFPTNTGSVNFHSLFDKKNKPSEKELIQIAKDYQTLLQNSTGYAREAFFAISNSYFNQVKNFSKSIDARELSQLEIFENYNYTEQPEKIITSFDINTISKKNSSFAHYILAQAYFLSNKKTEAQKHITELEKSKEEHWLNAAKSLMVKYN